MIDPETSLFCPFRTKQKWECEKTGNEDSHFRLVCEAAFNLNIEKEI